MSEFTTHTPETAPEDSREILEGAKQAYGFIPNLLGNLANSPATLKAYTTLSGIFSSGSFSPTEQQVVMMAANRFHECEYCIAAHSVIAETQKVPADVIDALRDDKPIADQNLEALRTFTTQVIAKRGWVDDADTRDFYAAGFSQQQVLEVVLGVAFKTISNYTNHITQTPLDDAFAAREWHAPSRDVA